MDYESLDPDVRLMLQVRDDNAAAFEELVLRYQARLLTVLEHMVGRRIAAEDLAQDVFLRVYRARKSYTPGAKFSTWLFTIANNVARNALRTASRRKEVYMEAEGSGGVNFNSVKNLALEASGLMPTRRLDKAEMAEIVREAMASTLNERQRMATVLSKFEGMSYEEIAETMDLSVQAVKSLLSRARCNLRAALEPYITEGERPRPAAGAEPDKDYQP
jgi:RNA polymerase sigma-70 factor (ECF subfamily)